VQANAPQDHVADSATPAATPADPVVIVGSGLAGWTVARELRTRAPAQAITLVTADAGDFYSKPMLSNAFAQKKDAVQLVQRPGEQQAQAQKVTLLANTRVVGLDAARHALQTSSGTLSYSRLVLALGADPIRLTLPGIEHSFSVNDIQDYARLRTALTAAGPGAHVVTLGAGLIGSEFANDLVLGGYKVSVIDPAAWPIGNLISEEQGTSLRAALEALGVQFHCGDVALSINARPQGGYTLVLRSGVQIEADLVLSAVGLQPRVELARAAGLQTGRGIVVDTWGRTSDPDVYALGDCAAYTSAARPDIAGGAPRALPYILPIMAAAKAIAATLAGEPTPIAFGPMAVRVKTPALPLTING